LDEPEKDMKR